MSTELVKPKFIAPRLLGELPLLACWMNVLVAAVAQTATLPSRVYGLAFVTEPLLKEFGMSRTEFGMLNLWATLITAVCAVGFGPLVARYGNYRTYLVVMILLGLATALLSVVSGYWPLFIAITLARIFGQGLLALVSTSLVGKSFPHKVAMVFAVYSIVIAVLFVASAQLVKYGMAGWSKYEISGDTLASLAMGNEKEKVPDATLSKLYPLRDKEFVSQAAFMEAIQSVNLDKDEQKKYQAKIVGAATIFARWREIWLIMAAVMIVGLVPFGMFTIHEPRVPVESSGPFQGTPDRTVWQAIKSPVFIVFGFSCLTIGTSGAGIAIFKESLLRDRGFSRDVFFDSVTIGLVGVAFFKLLAGWLCHKWSMGMMAAVSLLIYAVTLAWLPFLPILSILSPINEVYLWSLLYALAFSAHTVVYYSIWGYAFGRRNLAQNQGAAHILTVTASGLGGWIYGWCRDYYGSYNPVMYAIAGLTLVNAIVMFAVKVPCAERQAEPGSG